MWSYKCPTCNKKTSLEKELKEYAESNQEISFCYVKCSNPECDSDVYGMLCLTPDMLE